MSRATNWLLTGCWTMAWAGAAAASPIQLFIDPMFGSTENTGARASLLISFDTEGMSELMTIAITNATPPEVGALLTAVGLELPPVLGQDPVFAAGGIATYFDRLAFDASVAPPHFNAAGGYDLMITSDGNFLGGSPQGAPAAGQVQSVILDLGDTGLSPEQLTDAARDFYFAQTQNFLIGRFQAVGRFGEDSDKVLGGVPEPGMVVLMLCGLAAMLRRPKHQTAR